MQDTIDTIPDLKEKIAGNAIERKQLHEVTALIGELKRLMVRHGTILKEEGVRKEMQQLENWLDAERSGPAPVGIISESGITWLCALRDRLKLSVDEAQRLEGEGGNPASKDQNEHTEELLKTIRRIDKIIDDNSTAKAH